MKNLIDLLRKLLSFLRVAVSRVINPVKSYWLAWGDRRAAKKKANAEKLAEKPEVKVAEGKEEEKPLEVETRDKRERRSTGAMYFTYGIIGSISCVLAVIISIWFVKLIAWGLAFIIQLPGMVGTFLLRLWNLEWYHLSPGMLIFWRVVTILGILYLLYFINAIWTAASERRKAKRAGESQKKVKEKETEEKKYARILGRSWKWWPFVTVPPGYAATFLFLGHAYRYWRKGLALKWPLLEDVIFIDMRSKPLELETTWIATAGLAGLPAMGQLPIPEDMLGWYKGEEDEAAIRSEVGKRIKTELGEKKSVTGEREREIDKEVRDEFKKKLALETRGAQGMFNLFVVANIEDPIKILQMQPEFRKETEPKILKDAIAKNCSGALQRVLPDMLMEDCFFFPDIVLIAGRDNWDLLGLSSRERRKINDIIEKRDQAELVIKEELKKPTPDLATIREKDAEIERCEQELKDTIQEIMRANEGAGYRRWMDVLTEAKIKIHGEKKPLTLLEINLANDSHFQGVIGSHSQSVLALLWELGIRISQFRVTDFNAQPEVQKLIEKRTQARLEREVNWTALKKRIDEENTDRSAREMRAIGSGRTVTAMIETVMKWMDEKKIHPEWKPSPQYIEEIIRQFETLRRMQNTKDSHFVAILGDLIKDFKKMFGTV